jgi:hypothetical protein
MQIRKSITAIGVVEEKKQSSLNDKSKPNSDKSSIFYHDISILEVWRLFIDGILQNEELGWLGFEDREKNYLASICKCLAFAFFNIEQELDIDFILKLHKIAMEGVSKTLYEEKATITKPGEIRSESIGYSLTTRIVSKKGFAELVDTMTKQAHLSLDYHFNAVTANDFIKITEETMPFSSAEKEQKNKYINFLYKCIEEKNTVKIYGFDNKRNRKALIRKKLELFIKKYKLNVCASQNILETLRAILTFARDCERMHVFSDGNGRIFYMVLLYFLFAQNRLPLPFMKDVNNIAGYSMDELITEIEKGWKHNIQLKDSHSLFGVSTIEILSRLSKKEKTYFVYSLEPLEPYFKPSPSFNFLKDLVAEPLAEYKLETRKIRFQNKIFNTTLNFPIIQNNNLNKLLSIKRKLEHSKRFGIPQNFSTLRIPSLLLSKKYERIYHMILEIAGDSKGPHVVSPLLDHWTKLSNFKNISACNALYGHASLKKHGIPFIPNALHDFDKKNLDENIICFSPGGFVDPIALMQDGKPHADLIRLRVDLTKIKSAGAFNTFFKAVDLGMSHFIVNLNLTKNLKIIIEKNLLSTTNIPERSTYSFTFKLKNYSPLEIFLEDNDLIYYGDLAGINRFCLLLPFIALNLYREHELVRSIYDELNRLNATLLKKILITMAQNVTIFSEYNFNGILYLTPQSIYDIHVVNTHMTYKFSDLSEKDYNKAIHYFLEEKNLDSIPAKKEKIFSYNEESEISLYNQQVAYRSLAPTCFTVDATSIEKSFFEKGYAETRSRRSVNIIKESYEFLFFNSIKYKEKIISQSLEKDCKLPRKVQEIIYSYNF